MATDFVKLFDERLCREILAQDGVGLVELVCDRRTGLPEDSLLRWGFMRGRVVQAHVEELLGSEFTVDTLKRELVDDLCSLAGPLYVDYEACFAELLPSGTSSLEFFPWATDETFLLLQLSDVDRMLAALRAPEVRLRVMTEETVAELGLWRERCAGDAGLRVAYFLIAN